MQISDSLAREIAPLEAELERAAQAGRDQDVMAILARILAIAPTHAPALAAVGQRSFRQGDMQTAREAFRRLVAVRADDPQEWINLALACRSLDDEQGEQDALKRALSLDPSNLLGLILRADLLERQGKTHEAAAVHRAVATVAPPMDRLHPDLRPAVQRAFAFGDKYNREFAVFLDQFLEQTYKDHAGREPEAVSRFGRHHARPQEALRLAIGDVPLPQPGADRVLRTRGLSVAGPNRGGYRRHPRRIPAVLATEEGFTPYISYPDDVPQNQFAELNNSPRWSAFHLYKMGKLVEENAARCPTTMKLLEGAPQPDQQGRTPAAMYSLLKPKTRIPPHMGVTNVRLVTHLPLIVPENCGFRVGNDTRQWIPGKAWVFDDTIEHEAWNDSDKLRVVLLFDIWHPHLTPPERAMISGLSAAMNAFSGALESAESR